jgi:hypothetical protein
VLLIVGLDVWSAEKPRGVTIHCTIDSSIVFTLTRHLKQDGITQYIGVVLVRGFSRRKLI